MAADPSILKTPPSPTRSTSVVSSTSISKSANPSVMDTKTEAARGATPETAEKHADGINEKEIETDGLASRTAAATEADKEEDSAENEDEDEAIYPKGWKLGLITIALCLSVFCMALDNTIIATAIPKITDKFHALDDVGWYASSYLLTTCAFQLIFGKLYTFYSIKWTYLSALFIFELGSLVCGVAPNSIALIIGRAIAGLGSAGIFSGAILIVAHTVPLRQRPTYTGLIGGMYGLASVAGPLMGGAFTDNPHLTWRWCFYINLPFGLVTTLFIIFFFTSPQRKAIAQLSIKGQLAQMDLMGTSVFLPGVVSLLLALQWGGTKYAWGSGRIIALLVIGALLLISFVAIQIWLGEKATVPPRIFKNRNIWGCALFGACLGGAFFVMMFYLPIWFQAIKGVSAVKSGIMNLPLILGLVIVSMVSGAAVSVFGYYTPFMYVSIVCMAIGAGLLTTLKVNSGHSMWIGYQFLFGAGIGFGMQQTLIAAQTCMPLKDVPIATAIMMFAQTFGGALIVSVGQNIFTNQLAKNLIKQVPNFDTRIILAVGATQLKSQVPANLYQAVLIAYNAALTQTYYVSVALSCLAIFGVASIQWISVKGKKIEMVAA